jgi:hypothetical protein
MRYLRGLIVVPALVVALAAKPNGELWSAFQSRVRLTDTELSDIDKGQIVSKMLSSSNTREVAAFGMIQVAVSGDVLVDRFRDIVNFKKTEEILQIGKFSAMPVVQDLKGLTLDAEDIEAIKNCTVGRCDMRLSRGMIERLKRATDLPQTIRQVLFDYLQAYLATGNSALAKYEDKPAAVSLASEFQDLVSTAPYLRQYSTEFSSYLENFPRGKPQGVEEFVYWSKEKFGLKPVISMTHVFVYRRPGTADVLIVSKQIYGSHYFDASMGITGLVAASRAGERPRSYLLYLNRSRVDALGGMLSGVITSLIQGQIQDGLRNNLRLAKQRLERP